jgi:hypothetical protein
VTRGVFSGLVGFTLAGVVLAALLGRVLPDDWSTGAFVAVGIAAAVVAGAAGGLAGVWQGPPGAAILGPLAGAAILGPLAGAALLVALQPQADLVTALSVLAVLAGATGAVVLSSRSLGLRRHG